MDHYDDQKERHGKMMQRIIDLSGGNDAVVATARQGTADVGAAVNKTKKETVDFGAAISKTQQDAASYGLMLLQGFRASADKHLEANTKANKARLENTQSVRDGVYETMKRAMTDQRQAGAEQRKAVDERHQAERERRSILLDIEKIKATVYERSAQLDRREQDLDLRDRTVTAQDIEAEAARRLVEMKGFGDEVWTEVRNGLRAIEQALQGETPRLGTDVHTVLEALRTIDGLLRNVQRVTPTRMEMAPLLSQASTAVGRPSQPQDTGSIWEGHLADLKHSLDRVPVSRDSAVEIGDLFTHIGPEVRLTRRCDRLLHALEAWDSTQPSGQMCFYAECRGKAEGPREPCPSCKGQACLYISFQEAAGTLPRKVVFSWAKSIRAEPRSS